GTEGDLLLGDTHRDAWLKTVADGTRFPMSTMPGEQVDHVFAGQMGPETIHFLEACLMDRPVKETHPAPRSLRRTHRAGRPAAVERSALRGSGNGRSQAMRREAKRLGLAI